MTLITCTVYDPPIGYIGVLCSGKSNLAQSVSVHLRGGRRLGVNKTRMSPFEVQGNPLFNRGSQEVFFDFLKPPLQRGSLCTHPGGFFSGVVSQRPTSGGYSQRGFSVRGFSASIRPALTLSSKNHPDLRCTLSYTR